MYGILKVAGWLFQMSCHIAATVIPSAQRFFISLLLTGILDNSLGANPASKTHQGLMSNMPYVDP